jgi:chlorobactene glucosyltransferase
MSAVTILLLAGWGAICNVWFWLIVAQPRARRDGLFLDGAANDSTGTAEDSMAPTVCIVVAARNESEGLANCLRELLAQDYPNLSVRVIDDRSEDTTFEIAQQFAETDPRVSAMHIDALPPKWMGKSHALWRGTRDIDTDWLLFTDVDCKLNHHAVGRVIAEAHARNVKFLSLWPRQSAGGFWEHVAIPLCGGIIALWFGSQRVNDPGSRPAFANGQFLLVERTVYEQIRGHEAVSSAIIEDIPLAEHAKKSGVACWVASGRDLVSVRMYDNYDAIVNGWARIYVGALRSGTKIALSILWLLLGSLLPYVAAIGLARSLYSNWRTGAEIGIDLICVAVMCASHLILMMIASYRFWGMGRCRRIDLIWYPLSVCVVVRILAKSWWWLTIERRIPWRDTGYKIDGKGRIVE